MKLDITFEELGLDTMFCFKRGGTSVEAPTLEQALEMVIDRCKKITPVEG